MLKAFFNLPNGTSVTIEGTPEDIKNLLNYYSDSDSHDSTNSTKPKSKKSTQSSKQELESPDSSKISPDVLTQIVNKVKTCPEAEAIERNILGKAKSAEADRVLLPLYIVQKYFENAFGLTTAEIETITADLGPKIKVNRQNANRQFVRTSTSRLVLGDTRRKVGSKVRYTLNNRGVQYMESVLEKSLSEG